MAIKILFVDSDPKVLQGLKRILHSQRPEWEMTFVESGLKALELMEQVPVDVVVTDLRLPGIDGIKLLDTVRKQHSHIVRIVLSGESDQEWILKSVRVSHQFLNKPCKPDVLKATINRNCGLLDLMRNASVKRVVAKIETLPSLPTLYTEIIDAIHTPNVSIHRIGQIVSKDLAMTAKILQLVNSAFFGFPRHISSPSPAVVMLGLNTVKSLVLSIQIFSKFDSKCMPAGFLEQLWQHNIVIGENSKLISEHESQKKTVIDLAYMAGLLHDTGKLILAANFPDDYIKVLSLSRQEGRNLYDSEREIFDVTHSEVGAYLMDLWGLPLPIIEALAFHHNPCQSITQEFAPLTAVHAANAMINGTRTETHTGHRFLDTGYLEALGLKERFPLWASVLNEPKTNEEVDEP